eukprot:TRINITY_DN5254_c0_g1_i7.p1 TRINITY_DN5254_c0_g1~~TRINITY_DN5254_c0_g1_i7.p1  ORF type:complete len:1167 (+),score=193.48 TRINITY_DN5254_c0_g1_i7:86-3586(+)
MWGAVARFVLQTLPSTLFGGFYLDPLSENIVTTLHLYTFMFFVLFPYSLAVSLGADSLTAAILYTTVTTFFVASCKYINYRLHIFFDDRKRAEAAESHSQSSSRHPSRDTASSSLLDSGVRMSATKAELPRKQAKKGTPRQTKKVVTYSYVDEEGATQFYSIEEDVPEVQVQADDVDIQITEQSSPNAPEIEEAPAEQTTEPPQEPTRPPMLGMTKAYSSFSLIGGHGKNLRVLWYIFPVSFGRPLLEEIMDRDQKTLHALSSIICCALTSWIGFDIMSYYYDINKFILCVALASCHFSLLRRPHPESHTMAIGSALSSFSRSFYIILFGSSILACQSVLDNYGPQEKFDIYGHIWRTSDLLQNIRDIFVNSVLFLPVIFFLGLLPQVDTLLTFLLEQTHIHVFGGSGVSNLKCAVFAIFVDVATYLALFALSDGLHTDGKDLDTQHFYLYMFMILFVSYILSTLISDIRFLTSLFHEPSNEVSNSWLQNTRKRFAQECANGFLLALFWYLFAVSGYFDGPSEEKLIAAWILGLIVGLAVHYYLSNFRTAYPFEYLAAPICPSQDASDSDVHRATPFARWDKATYFLILFEKYFVYPNLICVAIARDLPKVMDERDERFARAAVTIAAIKLLRSVFMCANRHYIYLISTLFAFNYDFRSQSESFILDFFVMSIICQKIEEAILKFRFVVVYSNPINTSWGSGAHAILHILFLPHLSFLIFEVLVSSVLSAPLFPLAGSCAFLISYPRALKFWERQYSTKRVNNSDMRLADDLGINSGSASKYSANKLNAIFYQHLFVALEKSLYSDIIAGRLGQVTPGDAFIITNDKLTALVHIIEIGNGFCSFQLRGMEFKGTYCQERELEEVHEALGSADENCCSVLPPRLDFEGFFKLRLFGWKHINNNYVIRTYSVMLNPAQSIFMSFDSRKNIMKYFIYGIIYYASRSTDLYKWLSLASVQDKMQTILGEYSFEDDSVFSPRWDEDFDSTRRGVSYPGFSRFYSAWCQFCTSRRLQLDAEGQRQSASVGAELRSDVLERFCYIVSVVARRCLSPSVGGVHTPDYFLESFHGAFQGDFRVTAPQDEWIFADLSILHDVALKALRLSLHLHLESFIGTDDSDHEEMYEVMTEGQDDMLICPETDALWEESIVKERDNMLTLRRTQVELSLERY